VIYEVEKMDLVKIFGSNMEIGDSYIHVRDENRNETEENRRFSAFFGFFAETFQVSPLEPLLTAPYRRVRTSKYGGLDAPPQAGRHTRLSFKALALPLQGMLQAFC
jgi:hypothetical protein